MADNFKPYRILHLTSAHSASDGRIFYKECRSLSHAGYEVVQVGNYDANACIDGVRIRGLGHNRGRVRRVTSGLIRICFEAFRDEADLYHIHDPDLLIVGVFLRACGKRVVYDIHEDLPTKILLKMYIPKLVRRPLKWAVERIENVAAGLMSGLVTATPTLAERFIRSNNNTIAINNFPDLKEFGLRGPVEWTAREQAVIYCGGISEARGISEMLAAVDLLPRSFRVRFDLAGWFYVDSLRIALTTTPEWKHVCWHGAIKRNDLTLLLSKVRVGLVVLRSEKSFITSQPTKLFEYMAAGIPVIASDFPLWRSIIEPSNCGILVDPYDTKAIARAIERLLANSHEAEEMGKRGRLAVERHFNWQNEETKLFSFYSSLLPRSTVPDTTPAAGYMASCARQGSAE